LTTEELCNKIKASIQLHTLGRLQFIFSDSAGLYKADKEVVLLIAQLFQNWNEPLASVSPSE